MDDYDDLDPLSRKYQILADEAYTQRNKAKDEVDSPYFEGFDGSPFSDWEEHNRRILELERLDAEFTARMVVLRASYDAESSAAKMVRDAKMKITMLQLAKTRRFIRILCLVGAAALIPIGIVANGERDGIVNAPLMTIAFSLLYAAFIEVDSLYEVFILNLMVALPASILCWLLGSALYGEILLGFVVVASGLFIVAAICTTVHHFASLWFKRHIKGTSKKPPSFL